MNNHTFLVVDLFCGAGGSSTGAQKAIAEIGGAMDLVAINHWPTAIETHTANHPTARHLVEDVSVVDPEAVVEEGRLDLLMASPECKFFSRARGGKPVHDQGRMNPWVVCNWLTKLDINCLLVENVPEFVEWGPLNADGRPDKAHKGEHFQAWFLTIRALGYQAEWRLLNAADYGDATSRTRFFLMARKDGKPITWPEPSHAKGDTGMFPDRLPWRGAREIIDWSNPGRSLLDDPKYLNKPLSEKTRRRIARGLERFGGPLAPLYVRLLNLPEDVPAPRPIVNNVEGEAFILNRGGENGSVRARSVEEPVPTATTRSVGYLVQPVGEPFVGANQNHNVPKNLDEPIPAITTARGGGSFLVEPEIQPFILGQQTNAAPRSTDEPAPTVAGAGAISLIQPSIVEYYGASYARSIEDPLSVVTAKGRKHGLANPTLIEYYGTGAGADVDLPLPTVTTKARHALANPVVVEINHGNGIQGNKGNDRRVHSVDDPLGSLTTAPGIGLANPEMVPIIPEEELDGLPQTILVQTSQTGGNGSYVRPTDLPIPTLTTRNDMGIATPTAKPCIVANFGERAGQEPRVHDIDGPLPTVTSRGAGSLSTPVLIEPALKQLQDANIDPRRIVLVDGQPHLLDIRFRMLQNPELARAMGFDDDESQYEFVGNVTEVTKQIGNAVPVNLAAALVKAALSPAAVSTVC